MATAAKRAYGTTLKIGDGGGSESFATIAEQVTISGPGLRRETVDVTSMDSTSAAREFIATLLDSGEVSCEGNFLPQNATQGYATTGLMYDLNNGTKRNFKIVFSDASSTTAAFAAFVTSFEPSASVDGALKMRASLRITGAITWSP